ncbi:hypothetical protein [Alcanivorax sp.]|jgi:hypothetical protein|uniref:hypothetical protein n=1 Tax=Alcanivorax sp. TaxID=1872427 RepID=UPI0025C6F6DD|nr:hypothetical protein [Alcanivorax sp.]MEE3387773.1 hypothetical protein [Pseudomonadota bacterium]
MKIVDQLAQIAESSVLSALSSNVKKDDIFEFQEHEFSGVKSVVMLVGYVSHNIEDGSCIAVLNPDESIKEAIRPNVGYNSGILKEIFAQKCDALVQVWVDAYKPKKDRLSILTKYASRKRTA